MWVWTLRIPAVLVVPSIALSGCSAPEDLFACNLPLGCPELFVDPGDPEAEGCAGSLVTSGKPGVLLGTSNPEPGLYEARFLVILHGDGTAVLQIHESDCSDECTETTTGQWQCSVVIGDVARPVTCGLPGGTSGPCLFWPWDDFELTNCIQIE